MNTSLSHLYIDTATEPRIAIAAFDLDGNILATNTPYRVIEITTGKEVRVPAHKLDNDANLISGPTALYRWHENVEDSLVHFLDYSRYSEPNHLIDDTFQAIDEGLYSPSFRAFKETFLIPARLFAIITARGHSLDNLERAIKMISEKVLNDQEKAEQYENIKRLYASLYPGLPIPSRKEAVEFYFREIVSCYAVSNIHILKLMNISKDISIPDKKVICMDHYIQDMKTRILRPLDMEKSGLAIGFSDDSVKNMSAMMHTFIVKREAGTIQSDSIHLYFTGKQGALDIPIGRCKKVTQSKSMTIIQI